MHDATAVRITQAAETFTEGRQAEALVMQDRAERAMQRARRARERAHALTHGFTPDTRPPSLWATHPSSRDPRGR